MLQRKYSIAAAAALAVAAIGVAASAAPLLPGNIVVDRLGDGTQTLANTGNTQFLDQYSSAGTLVNSTQIPDSGAGSLIVSGTATSEGGLSTTADGSALVVVGYNTNRPGSASLAGTSTAGTTAVLRGIATVDASGNYALQATTTAFSANNIRSAAGGGGNYYAAGANSGTVLLPAGATASAGTPVQTTNANTRVANVYNGNLYYSQSSAASGQVPGIYGFAGVPTAAATPALLITSPGTSPSPYDFAFSPTGTTAYVADDRSIANGGGIERFDLSDGVWSLTYTLGTGTGSTVGARGLAVDFANLLAPVVYATTAESTADRLISIADTGSASAAATLATAGTGEIFRGVDFSPAAVPEPASLGLLGAAGLLLLGRRHRPNP